MKLTPGMKEALLQIGFGVTGRRGGFFDESNGRVDLRSARALACRGLVHYSVAGGAGYLPITGHLYLTESGIEEFEGIRHERD